MVFVIVASHDKLANMNIRYVSVVVAVLLLVGGALWYASQTALYPFELAAEDSISSWDFKGLYSGNSELEKKARADIKRLNGMFGTEGNTDYILDVSIAGVYELLGDGAKEYEYLRRALAEDSEKTGLAWYNLGTLLVRLGAFGSARTAYAKAAMAQPELDQYQTRYLEFLTQQFPTDENAIEKAFADASVGSTQSSTLLQIRARWLEGEGRIKDAIADWKKISELSPASSSAVNSEIRRLEGKL